MSELFIETMPAEETTTEDSDLEHVQEFEKTLAQVVPIVAKYGPQLCQAIFASFKPLIQSEVEMRLWADAYFLDDMNTPSGRADDATKALAAFRKAFPKE